MPRGRPEEQAYDRLGGAGPLTGGVGGVFQLDREEQRRLALVHLLHLDVGVALGQVGQLVAELEQQLEPVGLAERVEVVDDLRERGRQVVGDLAHEGLPCSTGTPTELPHSVHEPS
ncbi:hypothetical protein GCM10025872_12460 [Barrientosiimonas endolithica]|uniref:Uncharacterized protein n=1 Tax=Barrientosiimonas endolithica TaxID=1535208 RepID=A0ABM8HA31_9MICO|nr:hypothetical protein GCM10025872_12460 [Barrientosiimonas endolithica]